MKHFNTFFVSALLCAMFSTTAASAATNLLADGGFEEYQHKAAVAFIPERDIWDEWESTAFSMAETADVLQGAAAMRFSEANTAGYVQQAVTMLTEKTGEELVLTIHYKVLSAVAAAPLNLHCSWELRTSVDDSHDKAILTQALPTGEGWMSAEVHTTVPESASRLNVGIAFAAKTLLLLDDWSLYRADDMATAVENTTVQHATKHFVNGRLIIQHNAHTYNALGQIIR